MGTGKGLAQVDRYIIYFFWLIIFLNGILFVHCFLGTKFYPFLMGTAKGIRMSCLWRASTTSSFVRTWVQIELQPNYQTTTSTIVLKCSIFQILFMQSENQHYQQQLLSVCSVGEEWLGWWLVSHCSYSNLVWQRSQAGSVQRSSAQLKPPIRTGQIKRKQKGN